MKNKKGEGLSWQGIIVGAAVSLIVFVILVVSYLVLSGKLNAAISYIKGAIGFG